VLFAGIAIYSKAFLETLAKHNADGLAEAVRTRFRKNEKAPELLVGPGDDAAATLVVTSDTPDEARLALLDLDVTAQDVRGQLLRWDTATVRGVRGRSAILACSRDAWGVGRPRRPKRRTQDALLQCRIFLRGPPAYALDARGGPQPPGTRAPPARSATT